MPSVKSVKAHTLLSPADAAQQQKDKLSFPIGSQFAIEADLDLVVHGKLTPTGDPATLIYTTYRLTGETPTRLFTKAFSQFTFHSINPTNSSEPSPEVIGFFPTTDERDITKDIKGAEYRMPIGFPSDFFQFGITLSYGTKTTVRKSCTIQGLKRSSGRHGKTTKDTVWWGVFENTDAPGIPENFSTLILLTRKNDEPFLATVNAWGYVDAAQRWRDKWDSWRGREKNGKQVYFDPSVGVTGGIQAPDALERDNLKVFWDRLTNGAN